MRPNPILRILSISALISLSAATLVAQTRLDFDDGQERAGQPIGTYYVAAGVTFSNAVWVTSASPGLSPENPPQNWFAGPAGIGAEVGEFPVTPWSGPGTNHPIVVTFAIPVSQVTIGAYDVGIAGARLRAFDASGQQLGESSVRGIAAGKGNQQTLSVAGTAISTVLLDQPYFDQSAGDGVSFDDLIFSFAHAASLTIEISEVRLCWESRTNQMYQVQYRSELTTNAWADLGAPIPGNGTTNCLTAAVAGPRRFYQLIVLP